MDQYAGRNGGNVAVVSEYNLKHAGHSDTGSAGDTKDLDSEPEQASTPDLVILLDGAPPLALVIEGKMFDTPNRGRLIKQIEMQRKHFVESLQGKMPDGSKVIQIALLPERFAARVRVGGTPGFTVVTWEDVARVYCGVASAEHALEMLRRALSRWDQLVSSGSGFMNSDASLTGLDILKCLGSDCP